MNAADLPDGSVVATADNVFIKADHSGLFYAHCPWVATIAGERLHTNGAVDRLLQSGEATVLRVGSGA